MDLWTLSDGPFLATLLPVKHSQHQPLEVFLEHTPVYRLHGQKLAPR
jgi:hypothetical protein